MVRVARLARVTRVVRFALIAVGALVPRDALACPVCFGQSDSPMASAANWGILVMLLITGGVLAGFASFFVHLIRRARAAAEEPARDFGTDQEGIAQC